MGWKSISINIKHRIVAVKYRIFSRVTKFCARVLYNVGLQHHTNNNHVERLHGTMRDREKTMRGLKVEDTPIVEGHRLYYNFVRPHESLDGKTPSEEAGITIEGKNKWLTLMKTSLAYQKYKNHKELNPLP